MDSFNWTTDQIPKPPSHPKKVYSAFCGIGGSMFGYRLSGMVPLGGCDIDNKCIDYFKQLHSDPQYTQHFHHKPLKQLLRNETLLEPLYNVDVLDASPSLPSFSSITKHEPSLMDDTLLLTNKIRPKILVVLTEKNLSYPKYSGYLKQLIKDLNKLGYKSQSFSIDCVDFGVAQKREFSLLVATNLITNETLKLHTVTSTPDSRITCAQAFATINQEKPLPKTDPAYSSHEIIDKYHRLVTKGSNYGFVFQQFRNARSYTNWTKIDDQSPSFTLTPLPLLSHYEEPRFLTLREYISLSSFPQDIKFKEEQEGKYLIGSSTPPFMVKHIAQAVQDAYFSSN